MPRLLVVKHCYAVPRYGEVEAVLCDLSRLNFSLPGCWMLWIVLYSLMSWENLGSLLNCTSSLEEETECLPAIWTIIF